MASHNRLVLKRGIFFWLTISNFLYIIVLLILAGISIAMLTGDNGLLTKATKAKTDTGMATAKEKVQVEVLASYDNDGKLSITELNKHLPNVEGLTAGTPVSKLPATVTVDGYYVTIDSNGRVTVTDEEPELPEGLAPGETATSTEKENYNDGTTTATVPKGFTVSNIDGETTVADGLVIYDIPEADLTKTDLWTATNEDGTLKVQTDYNQLVWIPVDNSSDEVFNKVFKRTEGYCNKSLNSMLSDCGEADGNGVNSKITENSTTVDESKLMYASVKKYGGFYIGRYEAGIDKPEARAPGEEIASVDVVIKKNKHVYNYIGWSDDDAMDAVEGGAVQKAREMTFANRNIDSSKTTLCYGVQWDAALNFIDPAYITNEVDGKPNCNTETSYVANSENKGWYDNNYEDGNADYKTGIDISTKLNSPKNIYDMAGNMYEWTMESYYTDYRVVRGGYYGFSGSLSPASRRSFNFPSYSYIDHYGFRVTLYL